MSLIFAWINISIAIELCSVTPEVIFMTNIFSSFNIGKFWTTLFAEQIFEKWIESR